MWRRFLVSARFPLEMLSLIYDIYYLPAINGCWYVDQKTGAFA
jgi:hypothetical protein